jgi:hypothetical protein
MPGVLGVWEVPTKGPLDVNSRVGVSLEDEEQAE